MTITTAVKQNTPKQNTPQLVHYHRLHINALNKEIEKSKNCTHKG